MPVPGDRPSSRAESAQPPRLLIVEDDVATRDLLATALRHEGYEIVKIGRGESVLDLLREKPCDAMILDVGLPDGSGIDWCREWRQRGIRVPVLMVTARADLDSRINGLDSGADDYLGKPFAVSELKARLRALLRRAGSGDTRRVFNRDDLHVDFARRRATASGREIPVTRREFEVLERLVEAKGHVVSKGDLLDELWGDVTSHGAASLEVIIGRLRRKLDPCVQAPLIRTFRGIGYAIEEEHRA